MTGVIVVVVALITILSAATGTHTSSNSGPAGTPASQISIPYDAQLPIANFDQVRDPELIDTLKMYVSRKALRVAAVDAQLMATEIFENSKTFDVNPRLVVALIERESQFNPKAVSSSGAMGLGQLLPSTASNLGVQDPFDISQSVKGTVRYIRLMLDRFVGNEKQIVLALASYKEGYGTITRANGDFSDDTKTYIDDILRDVQQII